MFGETFLGIIGGNHNNLIWKVLNMAIWQWDIWIVPREEVKKLFSDIPKYMDLDLFESINWWKFVSEKEMVDFFGGILPVWDTPWTEFSQSWGSDNEDRITVAVENDIVADIVIRLDLRNLNMILINSLIKFCEKNKFIFFSPESKKFIECNLQDLLNEIKNSRKMVFVKNPEKFFEDTKYLEKIDKENRKKLK
jgi:hypothetical protein